MEFLLTPLPKWLLLYPFYYINKWVGVKIYSEFEIENVDFTVRNHPTYSTRPLIPNRVFAEIDNKEQRCIAAANPALSMLLCLHKLAVVIYHELDRILLGGIFTIYSFFLVGFTETYFCSGHCRCFPSLLLAL